MNSEHKPAPKPDVIRRAKAGAIAKTEVVHYPPKPQPPKKPAPKLERAAAPVKKYERPASLMRAVEELKRLEATLIALKQPTHSLNPFRAQLQEAIEAIPINWDGTANRYVLGFVLLGGEWVPFHASEDCNPQNAAFAGGVFYAIRHDDGTSSQGPCKPYEWAHCTADDTVNYHWLDAVEEPETDAAAVSRILYEAAKQARTMDRVEAMAKLREVLGIPEEEPDYSHVPEG